MSTSIFVGAKIPVGEFFWILEDAFIGFDRDALHGHGIDDWQCGCGSVDVGCTLTVRAITDGWAIVRLDREMMPYGAPAPIGTVFQISVDQMARWPEMIQRRNDKERQRRELAALYCR